MGLALTKNITAYVVIQELSSEKKYSINELCSLAGIAGVLITNGRIGSNQRMNCSTSRLPT